MWRTKEIAVFFFLPPPIDQGKQTAALILKSPLMRLRLHVSCWDGMDSWWQAVFPYHQLQLAKTSSYGKCTGGCQSKHFTERFRVVGAGRRNAKRFFLLTAIALCISSSGMWLSFLGESTEWKQIPQSCKFFKKRGKTRFPLHQRCLKGATEAKPMVSCLVSLRSCSSRPFQTLLEDSALFLTAALKLSPGEESGNRNLSGRINCGWQRGALGRCAAEVSGWPERR